MQILKANIVTCTMLKMTTQENTNKRKAIPTNKQMAMFMWCFWKNIQINCAFESVLKLTITLFYIYSNGWSLIIIN
jgi:hypothetical protein